MNAIHAQLQLRFTFRTKYHGLGIHIIDMRDIHLMYTKFCYFNYFVFIQLN